MHARQKDDQNTTTFCAMLIIAFGNHDGFDGRQFTILSESYVKQILSLGE